MDVPGDHVDASPEVQINLCKPRNQSGVTLDSFYNMNHSRRGLAIIFNHETFYENLELLSRTETERDCENLEKTLKLLGFEVKTCHDLTYKELDCFIEEISNYNFEDCDCLLFVVLSHGEQNVIYAKDMKYSVRILFDRFTPDRCPTLAGKPKIYVIQACRGKKTDCGVHVEEDNAEQFYRIPLNADFLVAYNTIPGYYSYRDPPPGIGSWFIHVFCDEVTKHWQNYDLMTILMFITRRVAFDFESNVDYNPCLHKKKQIPSIKSMFTRLVRFGGGEEGRRKGITEYNEII